MVECALRVLILRCSGDDERRDKSDDEVQRERRRPSGGEHAAETLSSMINAQVDP